MTRYIIASAATVAFLAAFGWYCMGVGADRANAAHSAARAAEQAAQLAKTKELIKNVDALAQTFEADRAVADANIDRLDAANRGLRQALAARANRFAATTSGGDGGPVARSLEQCVDRYSKLAGIADGYARQLIALQGWAKVVAPVE